MTKQQKFELVKIFIVCTVLLIALFAVLRRNPTSINANFSMPKATVSFDCEFGSQTQ